MIPETKCPSVPNVRFATSCTMKENAVCRYECQPGFSATQDPASATCLPEGKWDITDFCKGKLESRYQLLRLWLFLELIKMIYCPVKGPRILRDSKGLSYAFIYTSLRSVGQGQFSA